MNRTYNWGRPALRYCSLALLGLVFGLPGCGGSKSDSNVVANVPREGERRNEMRNYMKDNPQQKDAKTRAPRNHP
jgi:hypothetical protein